MGTNNYPSLPPDILKQLVSSNSQQTDFRQARDDDVEVIDLDGRRDDIKPTTWHS